MVLLQASVAARGHPAVASTAAKIADRVGDADAYRDSTAYRASVRKGSSREVVTLYQDEALGDLLAMGQGKTTAAQDHMADAFGAAKRALGGPKRGGTKPAGPRGLARKRSKRW
jgi:hypothetical protein